MKKILFIYDQTVIMCINLKQPYRNHVLSEVCYLKIIRQKAGHFQATLPYILF